MFDEELDVASELALRAGEIVMKLYRADVAVELKGRNDPVTEADRQANEYLVEGLRSRFPSDGVVAEESPDRSDVTKERCWFVDPLDGTKEFIAQNGEFSVMLGLAVGGRATVGVVYQPVTKKLYRGVVGGRAELAVRDDLKPLRVSQRTAADGLRLVRLSFASVVVNRRAGPTLGRHRRTEKRIGGSEGRLDRRGKGGPLHPRQRPVGPLGCVRPGGDSHRGRRCVLRRFR